MPAITYKEFGGGLDRRLPINVQEADRLWVLRNAYITLGKKIKKRPGLRRMTAGMSGLFGFRAITVGGTQYFVLFKEVGAPYTPPTVFGGPFVMIPQLDPPPSVGGAALVGIRYANYFQGFLYVIAEYAGGLFAHHYIDGSGATYVADVNCPNSGSATIAASRLFSIEGETVPYCAAGDAEDWTTSNDAGFLPTSLQQDDGAEATAVGTFQDSLVVFFPQGAQVWDVAVDPSANKIRKRLKGVGTDSPLSLASFANDLVFLSSAGFRSMTQSQTTDRIDDTDLGSPVDTLVVPDLAGVSSQVIGAWLPELGQYWAIFTIGGTSKVWAYSYSRSSKLACWSEYTFPIAITGIANIGGTVYVRSATEIYVVDPEQYTDDGTAINVDVQMAFQDAKTPGVLKQFHSADFVFSGTWDVSYLYDPRDTSKETIGQEITGDTRPGELIPVEVSAPAIAPVFRHSADEAAEIDAVTLFYENLSIMG